MTKLTHVDSEGKARMVDVSAKPDTVRHAQARALVVCHEDTADLLRAGALPKGDALAIARIAGIMAAKRTPDLIPLCHPITLDSVGVDVEVGTTGVQITAEVRCCGRTGVEMEALTAVTVAALAIIDMVKGVDRSAYIADAQVSAKSGGRSGTWRRGDDSDDLHREESPTLPPRPQAVKGTRDLFSPSRAAVITISDRSFAGTREDLSGPALTHGLNDLGFEVSTPTIIPDEVAAIHEAVRNAVDTHDLVVTTGGTGLGPRDHTYEAISTLLDTPIPGIDQALRAASHTPHAALSRCLSGIVSRCLVICLPGSLKAVTESLDLLRQILPHALAQIAGADHPTISSATTVSSDNCPPDVETVDPRRDSQATS